MIRRPPRSTPLYSSAASDVYKRQLRGSGKLLRGEWQFGPGEIYISFAVQWNKVYMRMRHFQPQNGNANPFARNYFYHTKGNLPGKRHQTEISFFIQIEKIIDFLFGNDQHMPFYQGENIQESKIIFIFSHFVARNLSGCYFREDRGHG